MRVAFRDDGHGYYKPFATRTPILLSLLLITLLLIGLTELACRSIPAHDGFGTFSDVINKTIKRDAMGDLTDTLTDNASLPAPTPTAENNSPLDSTPYSTPTDESTSVTPYSTTSVTIPTAATTDVPSSTSFTYATSSGDGFLSLATETSSQFTTRYPTGPNGSGYLSTGSTSTPSPLQTPGGVWSGFTSESAVSRTRSVSITLQIAPIMGYLGPGNSGAPTAGPRSDGAGNSAGSSTFSAGFMSTTPMAQAPSPGAVGNDKTSIENPLDPTITTSGSAGPVVVLVGGKTSTVPSGELATGANGAPLPILTDVGGKIQTITPSQILTVVNGQTFSAIATPILTVVDGQTVTAIPSPILTVINGHTTFTAVTTPIVTNISGHTFVIVPTANGGQTASPTAPVVEPSATIVNSTGTYLTWSNGDTSQYPQITLQQYVIVSFLPLIFSVLYTIPWRILDQTIREHEPFYQLHQPGGATAENSLCLDYGTTILYMIPFKAARRGHFIVLWSSLISIAVLALTPLSSEALFVSLSGWCGPNVPSGMCNAAWGVYPKLARMMEGFLSFIAVLLVLLIIFGYRRTSGVYSEPLSIAGLASLLYKSPLLRDLREVDPEVKNNQLKKILARKRFALSEFTTMDQRQCYGIIPIDQDSEAGFGSGLEIGKKSRSKRINGSEERLNNPEGSKKNIITRTKSKISRFWWIVKEKLYYIIAFLLLSGLLGLIAYYRSGWHPTLFEAFMDSSGFGVRFMMTSLGVVVKLFWSNIDQKFRKLQPYHRLLLGAAYPQDSILVPTYMSPFSAIIPSLRRRHYLVALICFVSVLSEFLPICLANISFSATMTKQAYFTCTYISIIILILMVGSILVLIFRPTARMRPLPRRPVMLASVAVYVASRGESWEGTGLLDGLIGSEKMGTRERDEFVEAQGRLYAMGIVEGDGLRIDDDRRVKRLWSDDR